MLVKLRTELPETQFSNQKVRRTKIGIGWERTPTIIEDMRWGDADCGCENVEE